jgi:hypothetical protein
MLRRLLAVAGLVTLAAAPLQAQVPLLDIRLGGHVLAPSGDLADSYDAGFGAYGRVGVPLGIFNLMGSATWNRFTATNPAIDDQDVFTLQAGPHFSMMPLLDVGLEGAYISEVEKFGLAPNVTIAFLKFEVTASYTTTLNDPATNWITIGGGLRF